MMKERPDMPIEIRGVSVKHILHRHFQPDEVRCLAALEALLASRTDDNRQEKAPSRAANLEEGADEIGGSHELPKPV
jgi:hypothetical protein